MFCKNCGHEISNEAIMCPKCGVPTDSIYEPKYCSLCGTETIEGQTICSNCGASTTKFGLETSGWRTSNIKDVAKKMLNCSSVRGNMVFNLLYLIPILILVAIVEGISSTINPYSVFENVIIKLADSILVSIFIYNLLIKTASTIKDGVAEFNFKFNFTKWIPFLIISIFIGIIGGIQVALSNIDRLFAIIGYDRYGFVVFILSILILIVAVIAPFIYYVSVSRDYNLKDTLAIGIKFGFKNFGKLLVLELSFIPLLLLIGITFGILIFWKGYYMVLSTSVLCEKILIKEGFPLKDTKEHLDSSIDNLDIKVDLSKEPSIETNKQSIDLSKEEQIDCPIDTNSEDK